MSTTSYVYFIQEEGRGRIKIGVSSDVHNRMGRLRCESDYPLRLLGVVEGTRALEKALHKKFTAYRFPRTEWFEPHSSVLDFVATNTTPNLPEARRVTVIIPWDLVEALDGQVERMRRRHPGICFTRIDAVRVLLTRGLAVEERQK